MLLFTAPPAKSLVPCTYWRQMMTRSSWIAVCTKGGEKKVMQKIGFSRSIRES